uniref:poly(ADP-ribose) glycohydrolase n=1 Tax=Chenopodium quinoa TaxID=63459 RepID=A0A803KTY3_CHEQI
MENREDLKSILPYLPLKLESSHLVWPNPVIEALKSLSKGPSHSQVDSGEVLFLAISDLRNSLSLSPHILASSAADGYALFFDEFLSRAEAAKWFGEVVPVMADLLLRFPTLLESHYQYADIIMVGLETGLRLLDSQQPGIVFLSQELIAALLSCSFFCLFPSANRGANHLPVINFDRLFAKVLPLEHNLPLVSYPTADFWANSVVPLCLFEIFPSGLIEDQSRGALEVDFANKKLGGGALSKGCVQSIASGIRAVDHGDLAHSEGGGSRGETLGDSAHGHGWEALETERKRSEEALANTTTRLEARIDRFRTDHERLAAIEKENNQKFREEMRKTAAGAQGNRPPPIVQPVLHLDGENSQAQGENEVRTAVKGLRGWRGEGHGEEDQFEPRNWLEEIRFMINPELIAGILFLPSMSDNEAIEIVGAERFSNYSGYASTFRYAGNHVDLREVDSLGRRTTKIVAIDALSRPGLRQYRANCLLREVNKAFCGFLDQPKDQEYQTLLQYYDSCEAHPANDFMDANMSKIQATLIEGCGTSVDTDEAEATQCMDSKLQVHHSDVGIATGNWGCGAFGGDPEVKTVIQWLAASQVTLLSSTVNFSFSRLLEVGYFWRKALRPFILYYTFELEALQNVDQVCNWILSHNWTVGDLWNMLADYASKRAKGETKLGFFSWLLPSM